MNYVILKYSPSLESCNLAMLLYAELWLAPLQVARATSAATFSVAPGLAPLLFKIDSAVTSAASILTTFKRCANR